MSGIDLDAIREDLDDSAGGGIVGWRTWRDHADALLREVERLRALLKETNRLLVAHHNSSYQAEHISMQGTCPICGETGEYPHNIFGRIEAALARVPPPAGQGEEKL